MNLQMNGRSAITQTRCDSCSDLHINRGKPESTVIAGNSMNIDTGDGGPATQAGIYHPRGVVYDSQGNLYISTENGLIRKVDTTGVITTIAGKPLVDGQPTVFGNSVSMDRVLLTTPTGLALDETKGFLYVADTGQHRVVRLEFNTGFATTVAGNGFPGFSGDGASAIDSQLNYPMQLALDSQQNLIITDSGNNRIRRIVFGNSSNGQLSYLPVKKDQSSLTRSSDGTWIRNYRDGKQISFNTQGYQTQSLDRIGNLTRYIYDGSNHLLQIIDPSNEKFPVSVEIIKGRSV